MLHGWQRIALPWSALCSQLHNDHSTKVYEDMEKWFIEQSSCRNRNDREISAFVHGGYELNAF